MNIRIGPACKALLVSALGGLIALLLRVPLPWMIGPMTAMAMLKMGGVQVRPPAGSRETGQAIIGTAVGLFFTPAVMHEVSNVAGLMLLAGASSIGIGYLSALALARLAGVDRKTAFFASVPGGAAEMTLLGERYGSGAEFVAMAQSLRMMLVVLIVPPLFAMSGVTGSLPYSPARVDIVASGLALLFLISATGGFTLQKMGAPTPWMLGPLLCSVAVTASGYSFSAMPGVVSYLGQALIGCALGCRFQREFLLKAPKLMSAVIVGIFLTMVMSAVMGVLLGRFSGIAFPTMILATAPGGFAEMSITAKVLQLGVPLVTAFHVTRLFMLLTMTAPVFRFMMYLNRRMER
jgi:membrane AbrB-like protein